MKDSSTSTCCSPVRRHVSDGLVSRDRADQTRRNPLRDPVSRVLPPSSPHETAEAYPLEWIFPREYLILNVSVCCPLASNGSGIPSGPRSSVGAAFATRVGSSHGCPSIHCNWGREP